MGYTVIPVPCSTPLLGQPNTLMIHGILSGDLRQVEIAKGSAQHDVFVRVAFFVLQWPSLVKLMDVKTAITLD